MSVQISMARFHNNHTSGTARRNRNLGLHPSWRRVFHVLSATLIVAFTVYVSRVSNQLIQPTQGRGAGVRLGDATTKAKETGSMQRSSDDTVADAQPVSPHVLRGTLARPAFVVHDGWVQYYSESGGGNMTDLEYLDTRGKDNFTYWELHMYFGCKRVFAAARPLYDAAKWRELREHYQAFKAKDEEENPPEEGEPERTYRFDTETFDPPAISFQTGEKGRGLKAARGIAKGEVVFRDSNNTVVFTDGDAYRKFLFSLYTKNGEPYDSGTTCDVLVWSWAQPLGKNGTAVIMLDLGIGSLLNEPGSDPPNVVCPGDADCRATTDIEEGTELLCDYGDFNMPGAWGDLGLR